MKNERKRLKMAILLFQFVYFDVKLLFFITQFLLSFLLNYFPKKKNSRACKLRIRSLQERARGAPWVANIGERTEGQGYDSGIKRKRGKQPQKEREDKFQKATKEKAAERRVWRVE